MFTRLLHRTPAEDEPRGQILVIVAAGLIIMVAMVGLVVDGGYAWGQQRDNQNAADAASEAGAVVLAERLSGVARTDADVLAAVDSSVAANGVEVVGAWYANCNGDPVNAAGVPVPRAAAAQVGGGVIPASWCPNASAVLQPDVRMGVQVETRKEFETFLVKVIGFDTLSTVSDATAVSGYIESVCPATGDCLVLPVTIPLNIVTCDGSGDVVPSDPVREWLDPDGDGVLDWSLHLTVPLCKGNPGNVGWLDWTPTAGGTSELETAIGPPTTQHEMSVPGWFYVTATGNVNSSDIEDALNYYAQNQMPALIPMFDATCNTEPDPPSPGLSDIERCPPANVGGTGSNQWYHLDRFVSFQLDAPKGAYIAGSNPECDTGNGATSCLKGTFVKYVGPGATVGAGNGQVGANAAVGIQLIK
ncbi:MAG TPA: pilus assembly protein TadG-related protein [Candidatus Limnocylindria bacterium]|nr:pilus assembly protein TadG-related protein [Candidatus Limnocylindria bacterium]